MAVDDRGPQLAGVTLSFLGVSAVAVALRCYVRACMLKVFKLEDWLAIATLGCLILYSSIVMKSISYGAGKHLYDVPIENIPNALKMRWAGEIVYVVASLFVKFTAGVFLLRICSQTWQRSVICMTLLVCLAYHIFYAFMVAFQCQPVAYFWLKHTPGATGKCWSNELIEGATYAAAAINAIADWVLGLLPIALVRNLELSRRTKILVSCTLALGSLASAATIVRIPYIWQLTQPGDVLYEFTDIALWSTVENGLGLIATSAATLRPLFRRFFGTSRAGSPSQMRSRSHSNPFYSWRRSGMVAVHCRTRSRNQEYYRMGSYYKDPKAPERVRVHERRVSDFEP